LFKINDNGIGCGCSLGGIRFSFRTITINRRPHALHKLAVIKRLVRMLYQEKYQGGARTVAGNG